MIRRPLGRYLGAIRRQSTTATTELGAVEQISRSKPLKKPPPKQDYIILGARSSQLLPRKKPAIQPVEPVRLEVLDEQRQQLLVFKSAAKSSKVVAASISSMKPLSSEVSAKRYDQLRSDLNKSFTATQLREFVRASSDLGGVSKWNKTQCIDKIVDDLWGVTVSNTVEESSDVIVEKTIPLSRRDLFVILSHNGRLPRSWTKSGARIIILSDEGKLVVRSSQATFDWILASLHKALSGIKTTEIDLANLRRIGNVDALPLKRIQGLSNAHLEFNPAKTKLIASASSRSELKYAERLLVYSLNYTPRVETVDLVEEKPSPGSSYMRVIEDDAMDWTERGLPWARLRQSNPKTTISDILGVPDKAKIEAEKASETRKREFLLTTNGTKDGSVVSEAGEGYDNYANAIVDTILSRVNTPRNSSDPVTFTATFGYLLKEEGGPRTAFMTNIPEVQERCSRLPFFNMDIAVEESTTTTATEAPSEATNTASASGDELWKKLLEKLETTEKAKDDSEGPLAVRTKEVDEYAYLAQVKLVPSPTKYTPEELRELPPLELWLEIDPVTSVGDLESARLAQVDHETRLRVSLPDKPADVSYTTSIVNFCDQTQEGVQNFLAKSHFVFSGKSTVRVPNSLAVNIDGRDVTYVYQTLYYRRQVDLAYRNHILQLSMIEGGGFGGRRIEANLVLDCEEWASFKRDELVDLVKSSIAFLDALK
ncbi:hypothetical protein TRVA0_021S01596 [Trichomonascus vanleenenianus]|uniref:Sls1p n=1 Tax=Trichomonascus vanleenenianus TaxID=2268995 RepID=UPI003ECB3B6C